MCAQPCEIAHARSGTNRGLRPFVFFVLLQVLVGGPASDAPARVTVMPPAQTLLDRGGALGTTAVDQAATIRLQIARDVAVEATMLRDLGANHEAMLTVSAAHDFGRLRVTFAERAQHAFIAGRDTVDLYTAAGASWRLARALRVGVDYVAQDLEDLLDDDHDGGLRQMLSADAQIALGELQLTAGPTFVAGPNPLGFFAALGRKF